MALTIVVEEESTRGRVKLGWGAAKERNNSLVEYIVNWFKNKNLPLLGVGVPVPQDWIQGPCIAPQPIHNLSFPALAKAVDYKNKFL